MAGHAFDRGEHSTVVDAPRAQRVHKCVARFPVGAVFVRRRGDARLGRSERSARGRLTTSTARRRDAAGKPSEKYVSHENPRGKHAIHGERRPDSQPLVIARCARRGSRGARSRDPGGPGCATGEPKLAWQEARSANFTPVNAVGMLPETPARPLGAQRPHCPRHVGRRRTARVGDRQRPRQTSLLDRLRRRAVPAALRRTARVAAQTPLWRSSAPAS